MSKLNNKRLAEEILGLKERLDLIVKSKTSRLAIAICGNVEDLLLLCSVIEGSAHFVTLDAITDATHVAHRIIGACYLIRRDCSDKGSADLLVDHAERVCDFLSFATQEFSHDVHSVGVLDFAAVNDARANFEERMNRHSGLEG